MYKADPPFIAHAKIMLDLDELPSDLSDRLWRVHDLLRKVEGNLKSRQAIAFIVESWQRERAGK